MARTLAAIATIDKKEPQVTQSSQQRPRGREPPEGEVLRQTIGSATPCGHSVNTKQASLKKQTYEGSSSSLEKGAGTART